MSSASSSPARLSNETWEQISTAIDKNDLAGVKKCVDDHGQTVWSNKHHYKCQCGCAETTKALEHLFNVSTSDDNKTYDVSRVQFIQKLIDEKILELSSITDEFIFKTFQGAFGWIGGWAATDLLIKNIPHSRLITMRDEYGQTAAHALICSNSNENQVLPRINTVLRMTPEPAALRKSVPSAFQSLDPKICRKDGYDCFLLAISNQDIKLAQRFLHFSSPNKLINWDQYDKKTKKFVPDYINILHRIMPKHAIMKKPEWLANMRTALDMLFNHPSGDSIDITYVSTAGVPAYAYIISYDWIDFLPISADEFWKRIGEDKKNVQFTDQQEYNQYELREFRNFGGCGPAHELDSEIMKLFTHLHSIKYKKDQATITATIQHIKITLDGFPTDYLRDISSAVYNATHRMWGYMALPEVNAYFETSKK
jgi:hypothetical protein